MGTIPLRREGARRADPAGECSSSWSLDDIHGLHTRGQSSGPSSDTPEQLQQGGALELSGLSAIIESSEF